MEAVAAERTSLLVVKLVAVLDAHLASIESHCPIGEFHEKRRMFGRVMGELIDIANSVYAEHPQLRPAQVGGSYIVPETVLSKAVERFVRDV